MCKCVCTLTPVMSDCDSMDCSPQASLSLDSPGKSTGVGCCAVLQGIFPPRDGISVSCLLHCQVVSLPLAPPGKPYRMRILLYICRFFKPSLKNPKYILITMSNFREKNSKNKKSLLEPTRLCLVNVLCSYCYYTSFCIFSSLKDS